MHTLMIDLCILLLKLKISITINKWSFIWKYKRQYPKKSQNDATINQIILNTLTRGD